MLAPLRLVWKMVPCNRVFQPDVVLAALATSLDGSCWETVRELVVVPLA